MVVRSYNDELKYLEKINPYCWRIKKGFQPNMRVSTFTFEFSLMKKLKSWCHVVISGESPWNVIVHYIIFTCFFVQVEGVFYVNDALEKLMLDELRNSCRPGMVGGFLPGVKQIANVAALPGIVGRSVGLPDVHSGYGFAIGWWNSNLLTFDSPVN